LPAGSVAVFEGGQLIGEGDLDDRAIGEEVEIGVGEIASVSIDLDDEQLDKRRRRYRLVVSNDRAVPIRYEGRITLADGERISSKTRLARTADFATWTTTVPANGRATLDYVVRAAR
jgi:hypothetical protein